MTIKNISTENLTQEEKICNMQTLMHIMRVRDVLNLFIQELLDRGSEHDMTKLTEPEVSIFAEYTSKLASCTFGSEEYNKFKSEMKPALEHHYANCSHHPEHYKNGVNDMTLVDLVEMFCDWKASSERHNDGNILKSIEINGKRFNMADQLIKIFENTARSMDLD